MTHPSDEHAEPRDEPCENRGDPASWDDPDIADAWQEPAAIPPADPVGDDA